MHSASGGKGGGVDYSFLGYFGSLTYYLRSKHTPLHHG